MKKISEAKRSYISRMSRYYTLNCKCEKCGAFQAIKIAELEMGRVQCKVRRFGKPSCEGFVRLIPTENREAALNDAVMLLGYLNLTNALGADNPLTPILDGIVDDVSAWSETSATPQEMGWVGQNGLP